MRDEVRYAHAEAPPCALLPRRCAAQRLFYVPRHFIFYARFAFDAISPPPVDSLHLQRYHA